MKRQQSVTTLGIEDWGLEISDHRTLFVKYTWNRRKRKDDEWRIIWRKGKERWEQYCAALQREPNVIPQDIDSWNLALVSKIIGTAERNVGKMRVKESWKGRR